MGIVGHPTDWAARASLTFRFTVDRVGQGDRDWNIPEASMCEMLEFGEDPHRFTITSTPPSGTVAGNTVVTVTLELSCERAATRQAAVEILLGEEDARATPRWNVECQIPPFDGELIGLEIDQGPFIRAWRHETGEWTWRVPPPIPWPSVVDSEWDPRALYGADACDWRQHGLTVPMVEVAGRATLVVARVEHGYSVLPELSLSVENADGTAFETVARASARAVLLAPGDAPAEHLDVRPPGNPERSPDNSRYDSEFRLEVPGSEPEEHLTGQPFREGTWPSGNTLVLSLGPANEVERTAFPIDVQREIEPFVSGGILAWPSALGYPTIRSPFELDAPERLAIVPIEASWQEDVLRSAPGTITSSATRHALSDVLAFLPFGDYRQEVVETLHVAAERGVPPTGGEGIVQPPNELWRHNNAAYAPHEFVMGPAHGTSSVWEGQPG